MAAAAVLLASSCSGGTTTPAGSPLSGPTSSSPTAPAGSIVVPPGSYQNPVVSENRPDPALLRVGAVFHLYSTEGNGANVQTATSTDLVTWTPGPDALPGLGKWASPGKTWAPEVIAVRNKYVMFYTASDTASGKQCIGRADSATPAGPFVDKSASAFVCRPDKGGDIDPNPVIIAGKPYLFWKNDGNCCGLPVRIWGQQLDPGARTPVGKRVELMGNTKAWQGNLVEGPEMVPRNGKLYLFYAANDYASTSYAEGYAVCLSPLGPCVDQDKPLLISTDRAAGPGHAFVLSVGDKTWMIYHAWQPDAVNTVIPGRQLWLDPLRWTGPADGPVVSGPNADPQPKPVVGG